MEIVDTPVWEEARNIEFPRLERDIAADVCVVGLGGSGLSCVGALLALGQSVVGLDAAGIAAGAAGRNGGFLLGGLAMFHHDAVERLGRDVAASLYRATLSELERMAVETPGAVRRTGSLRIAASLVERDDCERHLDAMLADGLPAAAYDGSEGRGLLFPRDASFNPVLRCTELARLATNAGAQLFESSPAMSIDDGRVVTPRGTVRARAIIVAVDGNLERILPELSSRVRTARLQMLATEPLSSVVFPRPVYSRWGLDYWQQLPDRRIVLGGARDVGGDAEWTSGAEPTDVVQEALNRLLSDGLDVHARVTNRWAASVAYTPTGLPIAEQVRPGVWAVGGYCGTGNVLGSLAGRAAASLVVDGVSAVTELIRTR
jgi:gamma-glutamylputrescine oxidase